MFGREEVEKICEVAQASESKNTIPPCRTRLRKIVAAEEVTVN